MKKVYGRRSDEDRRSNKKESFPLCDSNGEVVEQDRRAFGDRRRTEGLELSTTDIAEDKFDEVFKQFHQDEPKEDKNQNSINESLEILDYQVLYREGVECAYITILETDKQEINEPILFAFRDEEINGDSQNESKPINVENIYGADAYECYLEQGWSDISKSENTFPWTIKAWLAQNMKQDTIKSR